MSLLSRETPIGVLSWRGELDEDTQVTINGSDPVPLYVLISRTNGLVVEWLREVVGPEA